MEIKLSGSPEELAAFASECQKIYRNHDLIASAELASECRKTLQGKTKAELMKYLRDINLSRKDNH